MKEIEAATGWEKKRVSRRLHELNAIGKIECVWKSVHNICGTPIRVPAYRIKP